MMGQGKWDEIYNVAEKTDCEPKLMGFGQDKNKYSAVRCNRVYGCIECRSTLVYLGIAPNDEELFQCHQKGCSMHLKVLKIRPALVDAEIIAP